MGRTIVDLSVTLTNNMPAHKFFPRPTIVPHFTHDEMDTWGNGTPEDPMGGCTTFIAMCDHVGTHIDAFVHVKRGGLTIDQMPLDMFVGKSVCLDLRHIAPRAEITPADLEAATAKAGVPIPKGGTVLLCTGHHARTFPTPAYSTDNPGVNVAATEWLARQGIVHFGIDSMRPGPEGVVNSLVHKACLDLDITHMESLCNLETLIGQGEFRFIGLPLKWREGTGSPIRAVAIFDEDA